MQAEEDARLLNLVDAVAREVGESSEHVGVCGYVSVWVRVSGR